MNKWATAFALCIFCTVVAAQDQDLWRFWTRSDGLQETYTYSLGLGPGGSLTVRHGAVPFLSVLDGYGITRIPEAYPTVRVDPVTRGRATSGANGSLWAAINGDLMEYSAGRWTLRYQTPPGLHLIAAAPAGKLVLVLFSTGVREFDPASGTWSPWKSPGNTGLGGFTAMTARDPVFLISGERGLARLRVPEHGPPQWTGISGAGAGLSDFRYPVAGRDGEMFAQAKAGAGSVAVVRWSAAGLQKVYVSSDGAPRGWRGPDGSVWILEGAALFRLSGKWTHERAS